MPEERFMRRAIALAKRGEGYTNPNPMVGAVLVKDGRVIGEGYHARCGGPHAERAALHNARESPRGATLYVTLEPCCHFGRTPPCTQAILDAGIREVVVGSRDPNPKVHGGGVKILRDAGVEVVEDFLKDECDALNPVFFHYITTKTPYGVYKYAMTADGKIATAAGKSQWVTGKAARAHVQTLRAKYSAILVGIETALHDDPLLTCRLENARQPLRIVCDSRLRLPLESRLCQTAKDSPVLVAAAEAPKEKAEALKSCGVDVVLCPGKDGRVDLGALWRELGRREIDSVLVEGGGVLAESFLHAGLIQEIYVYLAPKLFGGKDARTPLSGPGISDPADAIQLERLSIEDFSGDLCLRFAVQNGGRTCSRD